MIRVHANGPELVSPPLAAGAAGEAALAGGRDAHAATASPRTATTARAPTFIGGRAYRNRGAVGTAQEASEMQLRRCGHASSLFRTVVLAIRITARAFPVHAAVAQRRRRAYWTGARRRHEVDPGIRRSPCGTRAAVLEEGFADDSPCHN